MISTLLSLLLHRPSPQALTFFRPPRLPSSSFTADIRLSQTHIDKYNKLVGWQNSEQLHPLYLQVLSLPLQIKCLTQTASPVPVLGLVHTSNFVKWHERALAARDFQVQVRFDTWSPHPKGWELSLAIVARDTKGELYRAVPKYLVRVSAPHVAKQGRTRPETSLRFQQDMHVIERIHLDASLGRQYAMISGDFNPIHLWPFSARMLGFKRPIVHGMWSLARSFSTTNRHVESQYPHPVHQWRAQFYRPLSLPGDATLVLSSSDETNSTDSLQYSLYDASSGGLHLTSNLTGSSAHDDLLAV